MPSDVRDGIEREQRPSLAELLDVRKNPDLAFQSYEMFKSAAEPRAAAQARFVSGEADEIPLEYVNLPDESQMLRRIAGLDRVLARVDEIDDPLEREVTFSSVAFRQAEMYFTLTSARLNRLVGAYNFIKDNRYDEDELSRLEVKIKAEADRYREQTAILYGLPTRDEHEMVCGEIWSNIESKSYHPKAHVIRDELAHGFVARDRVIAPLPTSTERLPALSQDTTQWVKDYVYTTYGPYWDLVMAHWDNIVRPRAEASGSMPVFDVREDMVPLFQASIRMSDPENTMGIQVIEDPDSMNLAWDTPSVAVICGTAPRSDLIDSPQKAFGKMYHEHFGGHGGRAQGGLATGIPIAAYGVFTEEDPASGIPGDYITYEEGQNKIVEAALRMEGGGSPNQWTFTDVRHSFNIGLELLDGRDTIDVYELGWRIVLLEMLEDNQEPTEAMIKTAKIRMVRSLERYQRSRPPRVPEFAGKIVFTKDLMYARGRCLASRAVEEWAGRNDRESFANAHTMKTNPTSEVHRRLMAHAGRPVRLDNFEMAA